MPCRQRPAGGFVAVVTKQIEAGRALTDIYPARFCTLCRKEDAMSRQRIQLSDHFTYSRLLRFVLPCIGTMLFTSIYGIVDGLCVSNFVGKTAFAAVNLIMPLPMLLGTIGTMLGTGGSAIVGITLGEGDQEKGRPLFHPVPAGGSGPRSVCWRCWVLCSCGPLPCCWVPRGSFWTTRCAMDAS